LLETAQQTKHLAPLQPDQHAGVTDPQMTRLNPQQQVETAEFLLAQSTPAPLRTPGPQNSGESHLYIAEECSYSQAW
jgi:hypothetical protein